MAWGGCNYFRCRISAANFWLSCRGKRHRLIIRNGRISLPDHPNLVAELLQVKLGATKRPAPCVKALLTIRARPWWQVGAEEIEIGPGLYTTTRSIPTDLYGFFREVSYMRLPKERSDQVIFQEVKERWQYEAGRRYFQPLCEAVIRTTLPDGSGWRAELVDGVNVRGFPVPWFTVRRRRTDDWFRVEPLRRVAGQWVLPIDGNVPDDLLNILIDAFRQWGKPFRIDQEGKR